MTVCAIHQPNYFPWMGYFDKICRADVFIFLDAVDYPRSGSKSMASWCNRVKIDVGDREAWFRCPVQKAPLGTKINEVFLSEDTNWRVAAIETLKSSYGRQPGFTRAMSLLEPLINMNALDISDFNINTIMEISKTLELETRFFRQSELETSAASTELLIELCSAVGCDTYLCGGGAEGYQEDAKFAENNIKLVYQNFKPFPYGNEEPETFMPGLSIIDFLMKENDWDIGKSAGGQ